MQAGFYVPKEALCINHAITFQSAFNGWVDQSRRGTARRPNAFRLIVMRHTQLPVQREKNKSKLLITPLPCRGHGKKRVAHSHRGQLFPQFYDVRVHLLKALICDIQRGVWRRKEKNKKQTRDIRWTDRTILYACAKWSWLCWVFSTICCELWRVFKTWRKWTVRWLTQQVIELCSWVTREANWGFEHACVRVHVKCFHKFPEKTSGLEKYFC